jgi:hypothetical protein
VEDLVNIVYSGLLLLTTIHVPNESIIGVAGLRKWCLVIVGDTITPDDAYNVLAKKDNVFYLSASYHKKFLMNSKHSFVEIMPFKSFARKTIGYLFALTYGARALFDFDDDKQYPCAPQGWRNYSPSVPFQ